MTDDTARRERALTFVRKDNWEKSEWSDIVDYQDNVDMDAASSERFACYLAGAREEAAIKDAEIAALREAVKDFLCECALVDKFRRYETWQITPWSMDELMKMVEEEP